MNLTTFVISAGRPHNVQTMRAHTDGMHAVWVVPKDQADDYQAAGADVLPVDGALIEQRNTALETAFQQDAWCVQVDDDLRAVARLMPDGAHPVSLHAAVGYMATELDKEPSFYLCGAAPTDNAYFARGGAVHYWGFCRSALTVTRPNPLRYDPSLRLKEDWDLLCQHLMRYGGVVRCDAILTTFISRTNAGGVQTYRTDQLEHETCDRLLARYPHLLRRHGRRDHELALKRPIGE